MPLHLRDRAEFSGETDARLFDLNGSRGLPYDLREGIALNSSSVFYVGGPLDDQIVGFRTR
jgi:hypothetical protein